LDIMESIYVALFCFAVVFILLTCIYYILRLCTGVVRSIDAKTKKPEESSVIS